jgi:hypothetical protein
MKFGPHGVGAVPGRCEFATLRPSSISSETQFESSDFNGNGCAIDSRTSHGFMSATNISNGAWEDRLHATSTVIFTRGNSMNTIRMFAFAAAIVITALIFRVIADGFNAEESIDVLHKPLIRRDIAEPVARALQARN